MTLSRKIALPRSRSSDSAPPARFESGRRASGVVGRSKTARRRFFHGACAPKCKLSTETGQVQATQNTNWGVRVAHIESKMDFVATREDVALVRREIEGTRTEIERTHTEIAKTDARIADLRVKVLKGIGGVKTEVADVKTLIANREASMQCWLLGITATNHRWHEHGHGQRGGNPVPSLRIVAGARAPRPRILG